MNSRLEQFVNDHREEFDGEEPDNKIWEKIRQQTEPEKKKQGQLVRLYRVRWSAAAAVAVLMAGAAWYYIATNHRGQGSSGQGVIASHQPTASDTGKKDQSIAAQTPTDTHAPATTAAPLPPAGNPLPTLAANSSKDGHDNSSNAGSANRDNSTNKDLDASVNEEMYHYARLVELKHKELKTIEKDEPLLYKQFASDVNKLDSVYRNLQEQLPTNPNREQLLEAMLQNLQLQMGLLNHQLDIIKQINHSKKTTYDKAYKTA